MTIQEANALTGRVVLKDGLNYTVTSANTHGQICVWDDSKQTLLRFDSRETFEHWAYGAPVSSRGAVILNAKSVATTKPRWTFDGLYVWDGSVVGTVSQAANRLWYAHGCQSDWQDVSLGSFERETQAKKAVESWVKDES